MNGIYVVEIIIDSHSSKILGAKITLDKEKKPVYILNLVETMHDRVAATLEDLVDFFLIAHRDSKDSKPPEEDELF